MMPRRCRGVFYVEPVNRTGFEFYDPSTLYHLLNGSFGGGENYHRKVA